PPPMNKTFMRWAIALVALLLLAFAVGRALQARRTAAAELATAASAPLPTLELTAQDVLALTRQELARGIEVSGSIKAVNSAVVKAKLAAELQSVAVREGDAVRAGQVLAQLDTTEFDWRLRQAEQQALAAKTQLEIAQ